MARIRTIKPEFFRHEGLQELQSQQMTVPVMLVYAGLWGHCDKNGTFEWRSKQLKLDILPFLDFDMEHALGLLEGAGFIKKFEAQGKQYGSIGAFSGHQRISGSELTDPAKYPEFKEEAKKEEFGKQPRSTQDQLVGQEGKGREGNIPAMIPPRAKRSGFPQSFAISESTREWARAKGYEPFLEAHFDYFRDYAASSGKVYADWDAAFRNCIKGDWGGVRKNFKPPGGARRLAL